MSRAKQESDMTGKQDDKNGRRTTSAPTSGSDVVFIRVEQLLLKTNVNPLFIQDLNKMVNSPVYLSDDPPR
jgi:hypothetical protein